MSEALHPEVVILNAALGLPDSERSAYLDKACSDDKQLRRQVEALLESHERAGGFLEMAPGGGNGGDVGARSAAVVRSGDRVGRYLLREPIGEGGCGVVYRAEQEEPLRREVALKIVKLGMDTRAVILRFEAERQALARMDHPHIARVLDAGAIGADSVEAPIPLAPRLSPLASGRPFFVMELVRGTRITEFCETRQLSIPERLTLFIQVCQAIQHAHQKGVIHRDIKPSNILVALHDGTPIPKVIDFGIAKATQGRLGEHTAFTACEQFLGTPAYMSPEQAGADGSDVDTRSDIYSLGVLLYELLTGTTPFDAQELVQAGLDEMRRTIRETEPEKPSARLARTRAGVSANSPPPSRSSPLASDLDCIVLKCLEKDRSRRYATAHGLAADVERHLRCEPVHARPAEWGYRFRRFIRRHRLAVAVAGALVAALLITSVGSLVAAWRVAGARRAEQNEREKAEAANQRLRGTIRLLELGRAEGFFQNHDASLGVAHLAAMLRRDPSNAVAAHRLMSALLHRDWALALPGPDRRADPVLGAWFSPDGRRILCVGREGLAIVWDLQSRMTAASMTHGGPIVQAGFNPDGDRLLTASADGSARIWEAASGTPLTPPLTHEGAVHWAEFSPDGGRVVTAGADGRARIWDSILGSPRQELPGSGGEMLQARFSPDGRIVATGTERGRLRTWDAETGRLLLTVDRPARIHALNFSPDGRKLVAAYGDGQAQIWNCEDGTPVGEALRHAKEGQAVWQAVFSPDGRRVLTTGEDSSARLWDGGKGHPVGLPLAHQGGVLFGTFSRDGRILVTTSMDNTARLWDAHTGLPASQPLRDHERVVHADFSPDGRQLVTASFHGAVRRWDLQPRRATPLELDSGSRLDLVTFRRDGERLLTGAADGTVRQWATAMAREVAPPVQLAGWVRHAEYGPDGRWLVAAAALPQAHVLEAATGQVIAGPFQHSAGLWFAGFSPDGHRLVTASADGTARVWEVRGGRALTPPLRHPSAVRRAQFSPDGQRLVTISEEHARVWDAATGAAVTEPLRHADHLKWVEFSPDGGRILTASTDNTACIWDLRTGRPAAPLLRHGRIVEKAVFSPDGERVATASLDRTARIWDARTGLALTPVLAHDSPLTEVCFSPEGGRLLTVASGGRARMWDVESGSPLTEWFDQDRAFGAAFDPAGQRIALGGRGVHLWAAPRTPPPAPDWFLVWTEEIAGIRLDVQGTAELVMMSGTAPPLDGGFYDQLAHWFLANPADRPRTPF